MSAMSAYPTFRLAQHPLHRNGFTMSQKCRYKYIVAIHCYDVRSVNILERQDIMTTRKERVSYCLIVVIYCQNQQSVGFGIDIDIEELSKYYMCVW